MIFRILTLAYLYCTLFLFIYNDFTKSGGYGRRGRKTNKKKKKKNNKNKQIRGGKMNTNHMNEVIESKANYYLSTKNKMKQIYTFIVS